MNDSMTESERYRGLLLALCQYHENLKQDARYKREKAPEAKTERKKGAWLHDANLFSDQRAAIRWMLFRRKPDLENFFGSSEPEYIVTNFAPHLNENDLRLAGKIPARKLGKRRKSVDGDMSKVVNWRIRHLDL